MNPHIFPSILIRNSKKQICKKIQFINPIVNIITDPGSSYAIWNQINQKLIHPFVSGPLQTYDLTNPKQPYNNDTLIATIISSIKQKKVAIKSPVLNRQQNTQKKNSVFISQQIKKKLQGTLFNQPLIAKNIPPIISNWKKSIIVARHNFGDQYNCINFKTDPEDQIVISIRKKDGLRTQNIINSKLGGVFLGMYNHQESIRSFSKVCFQFAIDRKIPLYFSAKHTLLTSYDGIFKQIFENQYQKNYRKLFQERKIWYQYRKMEDMIKGVIRSEGGFVWACKNYDGDISSNLVSQAFGSKQFNLNYIINKDKVFYCQPQTAILNKQHKNQQPSYHCASSIVAWARTLRHRSKLDNLPELLTFSGILEQTVIQAIQAGKMTKDLALLSLGLKTTNWCSTSEFINQIENRMKKRILIKQEQS